MYCILVESSVEVPGPSVGAPGSVPDFSTATPSANSTTEPSVDSTDAKALMTPASTNEFTDVERVVPYAIISGVVGGMAALLAALVVVIAAVVLVVKCQRGHRDGDDVVPLKAGLVLDNVTYDEGTVSLLYVQSSFVLSQS